jgi:hypothetical protein
MVTQIKLANKGRRCGGLGKGAGKLMRGKRKVPSSRNVEGKRINFFR